MNLRAIDRITFGLGGAVYAVKEAAYIMFVLLFYTQVLGLSGTITGIALFISIIWDGLSDPMVGTWSDKFRSRWGRRHPFMVFGAFPLGLGLIALFNPPAFILADSIWLGLWLLGCSLWIRTALTLFSIPHVSLVAEITQNYHERSRLLGMRTGFLFLMTLLLPAFSLYFLFGETDGEDGRFVIENYVTYGWISAVLVWLVSSITIAGTWKYIDDTKVAMEKMPSSGGLVGMWRDFMSTFESLNFRNLLYYDIAASSSYGITIALNIIIWTYYWGVDAEQTGLILGVSVVLAVPLALLTLGPISRRWPKHKIVSLAVICMLIDVMWMFPLRLLDILPANGHPVIFAGLALQNMLFMYFFILRITSAYSITADLTDEHEVRSGKRQEGGFNSVFAFTSKLGNAVGPLFGGFALDVIGLTEGMAPGDVDQGVIDGLLWAIAIGVVPLMLIALYFTTRFSMSEEQLLEIQNELAVRRSRDES